MKTKKDNDYLPRPVDKKGQSIATKLIKCKKSKLK